MSAVENFSSRVRAADEEKKSGDQCLQVTGFQMADTQGAKEFHLAAMVQYLACLKEIKECKSGNLDGSSNDFYPFDAREKIIKNMLDILKNYECLDTKDQKEMRGLMQKEKMSDILGGVNLISIFPLIMSTVPFVLLGLMALFTGDPFFVTPLIAVSCVLVAAIALNAITGHYLVALESRMEKAICGMQFTEASLRAKNSFVEVALVPLDSMKASHLAETPALPLVEHPTPPTEVKQENQDNKNLTLG